MPTMLTPVVWAVLIHFSNSNEKNKIIIIGDMFELGKEQYIIIKKLLIFVKKLILESFIVGEIFSRTNFPKEFISKLNVNELIDDLKSFSIKNFILVKGSRELN